MNDAKDLPPLWIPQWPFLDALQIKITPRRHMVALSHFSCFIKIKTVLIEAAAHSPVATLFSEPLIDDKRLLEYEC